ncbi:hypothetical protein Dimus_003778, partial [Dionaea muscipula]
MRVVVTMGVSNISTFRPKLEAKADEMKEWDAPVSKRTLAKVLKIRRVPRATDASVVVPGASTSATTSGALTPPIAYTLPWVSCVEGPPLKVSFAGALLVPVPDTCTEWAEWAEWVGCAGRKACSVGADYDDWA